MKKSYVSILILMSMLFSISACGSNQSPEDTDASVNDDTTATEEVMTDIYADVPKADYGEEVITIAHEAIIANDWAIRTIDPESGSGEVLDNAIYKRNLAVEEALNVKIEAYAFANGSAQRNSIRPTIMSGEDPYDIWEICGYFATPFLLEGCFVEVSDLGIDLEKPWWNSTVMDSLTFNDKCYSMAGDMTVMFWEASQCFVFNKTIADKNLLEDHYELVRSGKWTWDAASKAMKAAYDDKNGNTEIDDSDIFGIATTDRLMSILMYGAGENIIEMDSDNLPVFNGLNERTVDMYEKILKMFYTDEAFIGGKTTLKGSTKNFHDIFAFGQSLYYCEPIGVHMRLRNVDFDYGFLPIPKYDESQDGYITPLGTYTYTLHVTAVHDAPEMVGVVLENLCAESYKTVRPAYFDKVVEGKRVQDEETIEMFGYIFDNIVFPPVCLYNWGNLQSTMMSNAAKGTEEIVSAIEAIKPAVQEGIETMINFYS